MPLFSIKGDLMIKINKTEISITRGDTAYIEFSLTDAFGHTIVLHANDRVRCQVRDKVDGNLIFEGLMSYDNNHIIWKIRPEDTADESLGTYYWDAQLEYSNGDIFTFVPVSKFEIMPEITMIED